MWAAAVRTCIDQLPDRFTSQQLIAEHLPQIIKQTGTTAKRAKNSLSYTLQVLRDNEEIAFLGRGQYRKLANTDVEFAALINMAENIVKDNAIDKAVTEYLRDIVRPAEEANTVIPSDTTSTSISQAPAPSTYQKQAIPKSLRRKVWRNYFGTDMIGDCYCCGAALDYDDNYECGYRVAEAKGGATVEENLQPICRQCNRSMGTTSISEYAALFEKRPVCIFKRPIMKGVDVMHHVMTHTTKTLAFTTREVECLANICVFHCDKKFKAQSIVGRFLEMLSLESFDYSRVAPNDMISLANYFLHMQICHENKLMATILSTAEAMKQFMTTCYAV